MSQVKWNRPDFAGVTSKCGRWNLQASRDHNDKPISWSVFDNTTNPEWLDDRLTEVDTLAEAKQYVARLAA